MSLTKKMMDRTPINNKIRFIQILICFMSFQFFAQEVELISFKKSDCEEEKGIGDSILFKEQNNGTLTIKITAEFNCCGSVSGSVDLKKRLFKKNVLNLVYEDYSEDYCNCICYFEYIYTIIGLKNEKYEIHINNKKVE